MKLSKVPVMALGFLQLKMHFVDKRTYSPQYSVVGLEFECAVKTVTWDLALQVKKMEVLQDFHCGTGLRLERGCWPPSYTQELATVGNAVTPTEVDIDIVNAI
jgi:hypothetical protein